MKHLLFSFAILFGMLSFSQQKTYTKSQLDSISKMDVMPKTDSTSFKIIEHVPIYNGCNNEKGNLAKKNCMSQKIGQLFTFGSYVTINKHSIAPTLLRYFDSLLIYKTLPHG